MDRVVFSVRGGQGHMTRGEFKPWVSKQIECREYISFRVDQHSRCFQPRGVSSGGSVNASIIVCRFFCYCSTQDVELDVEIPNRSSHSMSMA